MGAVREAEDDVVGCGEGVLERGRSARDGLGGGQGGGRCLTGGRAPDINLGFYMIEWVDWWPVLLGLGFVLVTLFAPKGLGGLVDYIVRKDRT